MFGLGTWELLLILLIILVIFGAGKLPEIGGSLGKALKNFKSSTGSTTKDAGETSEDSPTDDKEKTEDKDEKKD